MGIGHWVLGIGHWALGIGHWNKFSLVLPCLPCLPCPPSPHFPHFPHFPHSLLIPNPSISSLATTRSHWLVLK
ncbi:hypothetical protein B4U84_02590 [Westiellopsis prolifica IICB1]|nr:hypothetical protein B4U84_02590 [Westiellopsis prolifica IICB1]